MKNVERKRCCRSAAVLHSSFLILQLRFSSYPQLAQAVQDLRVAAIMPTLAADCFAGQLFQLLGAVEGWRERPDWSGLVEQQAIFLRARAP